MRLLRVLILATLLGPACRKKAPARDEPEPAAIVDAALVDARPVAPRGAPVAGARVGTGALATAEVTSDYAILLPADRTLDDARQAAEAEAKGLKVRFTAAPVPLDQIQREETHGDVTGIEAATAALQISVGGPTDEAATVQRAAIAVARAAAREGGWIVDRWTAEAFAPAAFDEIRPPGPIEVERWIVLQVLDDQPGTLRVETAGMGRFGLPELRMRGVPEAFAKDAGNIIVEIGAELITTASVTRDGELVVGDRHWTALWAIDDDGAALIEIVGAIDRARHVDESPAWIVARDKARAELEALRAHFASGTPKGERLEVKAGFATDDGNTEWMWLDVATWKGDRFSGVLTNQPERIAKLRAGSDVEVELADVVDYVHTRADGSEVGGETDKVTP